MKNQEKVWDEIAKHWNDFREVPSPSVVGFLADKKGRVLDLGCGSGRNFSAMEKTTELYATDFSAEMLKFAEKKAKKLKIKAVIKKSDSDEIPFDDDFFDATICSAVLHCIDSKKKRQKTIREIYRTLKPGCEAFISSWGRNSPRLKNKPKECFVPWSVKNDKEFRKGEKEIKQERYTYIYDLEELKKEVLDAGFKIERAWEERNVNVVCKKP
jgi:ubiquinone/menaquinone biosynthesis C-methylase UbiE